MCIRNRKNDDCHIRGEATQALRALLYLLGHDGVDAKTTLDGFLRTEHAELFLR